MARTRANDFEEKQHGLLLTAANVFATQGMEKASMAQIAQEAGVSKSLLYHYYPSKDALIFEIIHSHSGNPRQGSGGRPDDPTLPPEDRLETLVMTVLDSYRGADDQHKVQLNAGPALSDEQKSRNRRNRAPHRPALFKCLERHPSAPRHTGPAPADARHHVPLRHDELGLHVVQRRWADLARRLRQGSHHFDPGRREVGQAESLARSRYRHN